MPAYFCKGHPIGATGLSMLYELSTQLRGEAGPRQVSEAELAIQENGGGIIGLEEAACSVTILERGDKAVSNCRLVPARRRASIVAQ